MLHGDSFGHVISWKTANICSKNFSAILLKENKILLKENKAAKSVNKQDEGNKKLWKQVEREQFSAFSTNIGFLKSWKNIAKLNNWKRTRDKENIKKKTKK